MFKTRKSSGLLSFGLAALAAATMYSCTPAKSDDPQPAQKTGPSAKFLVRSNYQSSASTLLPGAFFAVGFDVKKGTNDLKAVRYSAETISGVTTINFSKSFSRPTDVIPAAILDSIVKPFGGTGQVRFKVYAEDTEGMKDSSAFTITFAGTPTRPTLSWLSGGSFLTAAANLNQGATYKLGWNVNLGTAGLVEAYVQEQSQAGFVGTPFNRLRTYASDGTLMGNIRDSIGVRTVTGTGPVKMKLYVRDFNGIEDSLKFLVNFQ